MVGSKKYGRLVIGSLMIEKSRSLLDISYDVIRMEIDDETFAAAVESGSFITSESLYDELEQLIERGESEDSGEE